MLLGLAGPGWAQDACMLITVFLIKTKVRVT